MNTTPFSSLFLGKIYHIYLKEQSLLKGKKQVRKKEHCQYAIVAIFPVFKILINHNLIQVNDEKVLCLGSCKAIMY